MNHTINPIRSLKFAQFNFCFSTLPTDFRAWNFHLSSIFGLRKQRVPVTMQFTYWYLYAYSLSDWSKSLVELTFDEETKILPRQSSLLRAASGKAPLKGIPGSCGKKKRLEYPEKGVLCAPFLFIAMTFEQCLEGSTGLYVADFSACPQGSKICHQRWN